MEAHKKPIILITIALLFASYFIKLPSSIGLMLVSPSGNKPAGELIWTTASITDYYTGSHKATWDWGDGNKTNAKVYGIGSWTATGEHIYAQSGVYQITLTVIVDDKNILSKTVKVQITPSHK